jgi:hypothetical protein
MKDAQMNTINRNTLNGLSVLIGNLMKTLTYTKDHDGKKYSQWNSSFNSIMKSYRNFFSRLKIIASLICLLLHSTLFLLKKPEAVAFEQTYAFSP